LADDEREHLIVPRRVILVPHDEDDRLLRRERRRVEEAQANTVRRRRVEASIPNFGTARLVSLGGLSVLAGRTGGDIIAILGPRP
jgi:hypothetical protein